MFRRVLKIKSEINFPPIKRFKNTSRNFCESTKNSQNDPKKKIGIIGKIKQYGKFGIFFYSVYYFLGLGSFYYLLEKDVITNEHVIKVFETLGITKYVNIRKKIEDNPKKAKFLSAYMINYLFEFVRIPTTFIFLKYLFKK
jgi:hypothetical protein